MNLHFPKGGPIGLSNTLRHAEMGIFRLLKLLKKKLRNNLRERIDGMSSH